jgi:hypothetical protein
MNVDDDEEEEVILDRRDLIQKANNLNSSSNSGPILFGINRFNIRIQNDSNKLSKEKAILLATTCISIVCNHHILYLHCNIFLKGNAYWFIRTNISLSCSKYFY